MKPLDHAQGQNVHGKRAGCIFAYSRSDRRTKWDRLGNGQRRLRSLTLFESETSVTSTTVISDFLTDQFMSTTTICRCCGEPFSEKGNLPSPDPNLCARCFRWPDKPSQFVSLECSNVSHGTSCERPAADGSGAAAVFRSTVQTTASGSDHFNKKSPSVNLFFHLANPQDAERKPSKSTALPRC
jgi:hypothetical protein